MTVSTSLKSKREWLVVCQHMELASFEEVSKVSDSKIDSEQLPIKRAVTCLYRLHLLGKEGNRVPHATDVLLQDCSDRGVRCIRHHTSRCIRFGVDEESHIG